MNQKGTSVQQPRLVLAAGPAPAYILERRVLLLAWQGPNFQWPISKRTGAGSARILVRVSGAHLRPLALGKPRPSRLLRARHLFCVSDAWAAAAPPPLRAPAPERHAGAGRRAALGQHPARPTVIAGDFNERSRQVGLGRIARWFHLVAPQPTFPSRLPHWPLDRIAHSPDLDVTPVPLPRLPGPQPSDHLPLLAEVRWA